jgi:hypothetical protein|tara:strand:+ start:358 stop:588 length:231 start_codon:yes stop_codon:yes gene_type:complete
MTEINGVPNSGTGVKVVEIHHLASTPAQGSKFITLDETILLTMASTDYAQIPATTYEGTPVVTPTKKLRRQIGGAK